MLRRTRSCSVVVASIAATALLAACNGERPSKGGTPEAAGTAATRGERSSPESPAASPAPPPAVRRLACVHRLPGVETGPEPAASDAVVAVRKKEWEAGFGGEIAARPHVRARVTALPSRALIGAAELPSADESFLRRIAHDTWRGLAGLTDRENGLPIDIVRFPHAPDSLDDPLVGDYTSATDIGLYLASVCAAADLHLIERDEAVARASAVLETIKKLESAHGFFFNFYDTTSLERTSNFLSFVDSAWLVTGLVLVRATFAELATAATELIEQQDFGFLYDRDAGLFHHGYWIQRSSPSIFHYGIFYSEARLAYLVAIGKGDVPAEAWHRMRRIVPPLCDRAGPEPTAVVVSGASDDRAALGYYEWKGFRYLPSWGGSMFEALMPTLVVDEEELSPNGLGPSDEAHARVQRHYALHDLGYPVWGISSSTTPDGAVYAEYGVPVLGARGYGDQAVSPHASALALAVTPKEAVDNLRRLTQRYDVYGEYGFYDSVDPRSGRVAYAYLALDQAMTFLAVANHLGGGIVTRRFASDPVFERMAPLLRAEGTPVR